MKSKEPAPPVKIRMYEYKIFQGLFETTTYQPVPIEVTIKRQPTRRVKEGGYYLITHAYPKIIIKGDFKYQEGNFSHFCQVRNGRDLKRGIYVKAYMLDSETSFILSEEETLSINEVIGVRELEKVQRRTAVTA